MAPRQRARTLQPAETPDGGHDGAPAADASDKELILRAKLAEYEELKNEIRDRSDFQHRLIQIHYATLAVLLAATFTNAAGPWILFLIPIESATIGLSWIDHALTIRSIGRFIAERHEAYISVLLNDPGVMSWETSFRERERTEPYQRRLQRSFQVGRTLLFLVPAVITLMLGCIYAISNTPGLNELPGLKDVARLTQNLLPMPATLKSLRIVVAWLAFGLGLWATISYARLARDYWWYSTHLDAADGSGPASGLVMDSSIEPGK